MWTDQEEDLEETVTGDRLLTKRLEKVEEVVISLVTGLNSLKEEVSKLNSKLRTYEYEGDSDHDNSEDTNGHSMTTLKATTKEAQKPSIAVRDLAVKLFSKEELTKCSV
ncbi:uncharacterized protein LOC134189261 [Corticium candelabrum]|uniref:uncharacterized protein LOC134189261 n=1 Tax=Corticium candelabrum TaxID=121492 RepID=UPI002E267A38|nr:uncharacterized protein LOC134189261 [Corticium candelabrum]